jgi:hypothetical protein
MGFAKVTAFSPFGIAVFLRQGLYSRKVGKIHANMLTEQGGMAGECLFNATFLASGVASARRVSGPCGTLCLCQQELDTPLSLERAFLGERCLEITQHQVTKTLHKGRPIADFRQRQTR